MNAKTFGRGFERSRQSACEETENAHFMRDSRAWSQRFGNIVLGMLADKPPHNEQADVLIESYQTWISSTFGRNFQNLRQQTHESQTDSRALSEINYHLMNTAMLSSWLQPSVESPLITPHRKTAAVAQSQNTLAYMGVANTSERLGLLHSGNLFIRDKETGSTNFTESAKIEIGATTEIDAAITLLEMTKDESQLVVIPSPGVFEHGSISSRNNDFIVFDREKNTAIGIQAKARVRFEDREKYDEKFVLLLDGKEDLGNVLAVPRDPARTHARHTTSWPGLISAHHLLGQKNAPPIRDDLHHLPVRRRMLLQESARKVHYQARAASGGSRSQNKLAADRISQRVKNRMK